MLIDTIVTDLDDTLLGPDTAFTDYTLRVVERCKQKGIRIIPASGRTRTSMHRFVVQLDTGLPYIAGNGSEIVGPDHRLMRQLTLDETTAREICRFFAQHGFYAQVYTNECIYHGPQQPLREYYHVSTSMKEVEVGDLCAFLNFPTPKILSIAHPEAVQQLLPLANAQFEGRASFTVSKPYFLEAEPPGATKGEALRDLAQMIGIDPERTAVFGDSLNDLSMLAFTRHSVAMGNARSEVRAAAAHVCRPNAEDGLARFVEEHILPAYA